MYGRLQSLIVIDPIEYFSNAPSYHSDQILQAECGGGLLINQAEHLIFNIWLLG